MIPINLLKILKIPTVKSPLLTPPPPKNPTYSQTHWIIEFIIYENPSAFHVISKLKHTLGNAAFEIKYSYCEEFIKFLRKH